MIIKRFQQSKRMLFLTAFLGLICLGLGAADEPIGVVVNANTNCIQLIDPVSMDITGHLLKGKLGSYGGGLYDVVITSDGKTAIVSNFGDSQIHFIDISGGFDTVPVLKGTGYIGFFAEDMVITPDDKYVLVADGGFSPRLMAVNVKTRQWVKNNDLGSRNANSVDITPDGKIVIVSDYFNGNIHSYDFNSASGALTYRQSRLTRPCLPVNTAISPDGRTVLVIGTGGHHLPVFYIDSNGDLCNKGSLKLPTKHFQSGVFSHDGRKAYVLSNNFMGTYIQELEVLAPGQVTVGRTKKLSSPRGSSQLFGVDTIALDPSGQYLFVSNPTLSGAKAHLTVLDVNTMEPVYNILTNGLCTGVNFGTIKE